MEATHYLPNDVICNCKKVTVADDVVRQIMGGFHVPFLLFD